MRVFGLRGLLGLCVVATALAFGPGSALAAFHGIATAKGCTSPVKIGDPYTCAVQISNSVDTGHDTVRVTGLSDHGERGRWCGDDGEHLADDGSFLQWCRHVFGRQRDRDGR